MNECPRGPSQRVRWSRRAALGIPFALAGCSLFDNWFGDTKPRLPGTREPVLAEQHGLQVTDAAAGQRLVLPPVSPDSSWPMTGGNAAHVMGRLAGGEGNGLAWSESIGEGGGYRDKILAQPIVAQGVVYTMDSDAVVTAFDLTNGSRRWRADTKSDNDDSTNVGGGIAFDSGTLYAVNGLAELVAFDAANGNERWRKAINGPARSGPTIADGKLFVITLDGKVFALSASDGQTIWQHQAASAPPIMLGQPAPAFADGLVVAGFGSGELAGLRADSGAVVWTDSLAAARGRGGPGDISSIRGLPAILNGRVYAISVGGLLVAIDLRSGRRLWEREVAGEDSPWIAGDWMFIISSDQQMAAIRLSDGRVVWVSDLPRFEDEEKQTDPIVWYGPVLVGERLYAAGSNEKLLIADPYTGGIQSNQDIGDPASFGPIAAGGTLLVVTEAGKLLAFR